jgi:hypothetical protein
MLVLHSLGKSEEVRLGHELQLYQVQLSLAIKNTETRSGAGGSGEDKKDFNMALATLLLPSSSASSATSSSTKAAAGDISASRRHQQHRHDGSKCKKMPPPPSPQPSLTPRTPPGSGSRRATAQKSQRVATAKNAFYQHRVPAKKSPAASSSSSSSWEQLKSLLSCRSATSAARVHDPAAPSALARLRGSGTCGASLCAMRDVVDAASSATASSAAVTDRDTAPLTRRARAYRAASSAGAGHSSLRGLSGCYECRAINVEPMSRSRPLLFRLIIMSF